MKHHKELTEQISINSIMTIKELVDRWVPVKSMFVKESTMSAYLLALNNRIIPEFGDKKPEDITNDVMQNYILSLIEHGLSHKSAQDIYIIFKMILTYSAEKFDTKYTKYNVRMPTKNMRLKKELEVYNETEQRAIISYIMANPTYKRLGILISLCTGMRIGEVCALKWESIDIYNKCIHVSHSIQRIYNVETGKTKIVEGPPKTIDSYRDIPIAKELYILLKNYKKVSMNHYYVITGDEKYCEPHAYRNYYTHFILNEVKLNRCIKFHGMRHSFATRMISNNIDVKTASRILGHHDVTTTMNLYVHPSMENKMDAVNKSMRKLFK